MNIRVGQGFDGFDWMRPRASMPRGLGRNWKSAIFPLLTNACCIRRPSVGGSSVLFEGIGI